MVFLIFLKKDIRNLWIKFKRKYLNLKSFKFVSIAFGIIVVLFILGDYLFSYFIISNAQDDIKKSNFYSANTMYKLALKYSIFNRSIASNGLAYSTGQINSINDFNNGVSEYNKNNYVLAQTQFSSVQSTSSLYTSSQNYLLKITVLLGDISKSVTAYNSGLSCYNSKNYSCALSDLANVIPADSNYKSAQTMLNTIKAMVTPTPTASQNNNSSYTVSSSSGSVYPNIVSVSMTNSLTASGAPANSMSTFPSNTSGIYAALHVTNVTSSTAISYVRYYNNYYIDARAAVPPSSISNGYFDFSWVKPTGSNYPSGNYELKLFINGYYYTSIYYTII